MHVLSPRERKDGCTSSNQHPRRASKPEYSRDKNVSPLFWFRHPVDLVGILSSFIHGYLLNELGCAVIYPNVRGSTEYGKRYCALDDVFKREDSVKCGHPFDHFSELQLIGCA